MASAVHSTGGTGRRAGLAAWLRTLVHPSAAADEMELARQSAFIGGHLAAGLGALAALPAYLAFAGQPGALQIVAFAWLLMPLAVAAYLSRTGRADRAHLFSAFGFAGIVVTLASVTGGLASYALAWLVVVPLEAALSGSRRVIAAAGAVALLAFAGLAFADLAGFLPQASATGIGTGLFAGIVVFAALAYAAALALAVERLHRDAAEAARHGEARYRLLADNVCDLITRHEPNGGVTFASGAALRLIGAAPVDLLGDGLFERVHVADRPAYLTALSDAFAGRRSTSVEFRLRAHAQKEESAPAHVWMETRCRPLVDASGSVDGVIAVTSEIGERKRHEADLTAAREEAERVSSTKSRFLASMSHELRTPLNAIIGFSEILSVDAPEQFGPDRRCEYARLIHDSGNHLLQVVNDILDVSRIEAGTFPICTEPFDVAPLVEGCCRMLQGQAEKAGVALSNAIAPGLPELVADKRACRQILINLVSNALKFTPAGGTAHVGVRREGANVVFEVRDSGIGIAQADLPRLGTPFLQADSSYDRRYEGAGLGLSVVKGLVLLHEGTLHIDSQVGRGTTVSIRLPLGEAETKRAEPVPLPVAAQPEPDDMKRALGA